ncbi:MAG: sec-independent protein translocase protein TatB [Oceanicoccus sp.]|jgi:sec-independent protein translocase protein TatB
MFDIGFLEVLIVFVIALLVLGPERMPDAVRQAGRLIGGAKRTLNHWTLEVNRQLDNDALQQSVKEELRISQINEEMQQIKVSMNAALDVASADTPSANSAMVNRSSTVHSNTEPAPLSLSTRPSLTL